MLRNSCCVLAVCLAASSAAFAASITRPSIELAPHVFLTELHHGLDWSVFVQPSVSRLAFLDENRLPAVEALAIAPIPSVGTPVDESAGSDFGWLAMLWIAATIVGLLTLMSGIPTFHLYRLRFRSLDLHLPLN